MTPPLVRMRERNLLQCDWWMWMEVIDPQKHNSGLIEMNERPYDGIFTTKLPKTHIYSFINRQSTHLIFFSLSTLF